MIRVLTLLILAALLGALTPPTAVATQPVAHVDKAHVQTSIVPMRTAIAAVRRAYPGADVLDGHLVNAGNPYYVIRILTREGRRLDVRVDARTGRVLG